MPKGPCFFLWYVVCFRGNISSYPHSWLYMLAKAFWYKIGQQYQASARFLSRPPMTRPSHCFRNLYTSLVEIPDWCGGRPRPRSAVILSQFIGGSCCDWLYLMKIFMSHEDICGMLVELMRAHLSGHWLPVNMICPSVRGMFQFFHLA